VRSECGTAALAASRDEPIDFIARLGLAGKRLDLAVGDRHA
jgi:hypothetical protein